MELDLDLDNYNLTDLLNLFNLPHQFDDDDLRKAKKVVMSTHPDKSNLPKEYFLFFAKAFKLVHSLHTQRTKNIEYILDDETTKDDPVAKFAKRADFQEEFNRLFEANRISCQTDEGYGEWLQSEEDVCDRVLHHKGEMSKAIDEHRKTLCVCKDIRSIGDEIALNLDPDAPSHYEASLFSKLPYEDLRKAHTETVIAVNMEDQRPEFADEKALRHHRQQMNATPLTKVEAQSALQSHHKHEDIQGVQRAFRLAKQDEEVAKLNASLQSKFLLLMR
jgi:hypothetical protein